MIRSVIGRSKWLSLSVVIASIGASASAQSIFSDDFTDTASVLWSNTRGNWSVVNGAYGASAPNNNPITFSGLPYSFTDFSIECDVRAADDGGIWMHADAAGQNGVLLVLAHNAIYWHNIVNGGVAGTFGEASGAFSTGQNLHLKAVVSGNTFSAYLNGSQTPVTTHTTTNYPTGRVALYDFRSPAHNYDNVAVSGSCVGGPCCALVSRHPTPLTICSGGTAVYSVSVAGTGPFTYRWQAEILPNTWCDLTDLQFGGGCLSGSTAAYQGVLGPTLTITGVSEADESNFRCRITDSCGTIASTPANLNVCPPDFDCDGFVSGQDFDSFVIAFEAGDLTADFDKDGFITGVDFDLFVQSFEAGC